MHEHFIITLLSIATDCHIVTSASRIRVKEVCTKQGDAQLLMRYFNVLLTGYY